LEGESLVNDATGLVLYRFAVAATITGTFNTGQAVLMFCSLAVGGVGVGVFAGFLASTLIGRIKEAELGIILGLLTSWCAYIGAEQLHVSGVLATVACGIVMGWRQHSLLRASTRVQTRAVWNAVTFVLESLIFILIGLSLKSVMPQLLGTHAAVAYFVHGAAFVVAAVIISRFVWIFTTVYLIRAIFPSLRSRDPYPPVGVPILLSWAGMRGVVSLAAALALPEGFPGRDFILAATFIVIFTTVVVQGCTLAPLIEFLRLGDLPALNSAHIPEVEARLRLTNAELEAVKRHSTLPDGKERHPRLVEQYNFRLDAIKRSGALDGGPNVVREDHFSAVLEGIGAARRELLTLQRLGVVDDSTFHILESELDSSEILAEHRRGALSK
jgi:CPA1 family monovalent cation:H+ antiporter